MMKRAHSKLYLKIYDGYLRNSNFVWEPCVSIGIGLSGAFIFEIEKHKSEARIESHRKQLQ